MVGHLWCDLLVWEQSLVLGVEKKAGPKVATRVAPCLWNQNKSSGEREPRE